MVFPVVMYRCENWTIKRQSNRELCFQILVLEKTLGSPLVSKEIKSVSSKEINPEYTLEGMMLKLKIQFFGHLI